jgi:hypothetical protein
MKREIAKSRPESRPRPRHRRDFFSGFIFEPRNRRKLLNFAQTRSRSHREVFLKVRDPARSLSRPIHNNYNYNTNNSFFGVFPRVSCTLSRTCGDHMVTLVRGEFTPPPIPSLPLIPPILPPSSPPPHFPPTD